LNLNRVVTQPSSVCLKFPRDSGMTPLRIAVLQTQIENTYDNVRFQERTNKHNIELTIEFNSVGDQIHWEFTNFPLTQVAKMLYWPHEQKNHYLLQY